MRVLIVEVLGRQLVLNLSDGKRYYVLKNVVDYRLLCRDGVLTNNRAEFEALYDSPPAVYVNCAGSSSSVSHESLLLSWAEQEEETRCAFWDDIEASERT